MAQLLLVDNPVRKKTKKKKSKSKSLVVHKSKKLSKEKKTMAKHKTPKRKTIAIRNPSKRTRSRRRMGIKNIVTESVLPAAIGGGGAVALDVILAMMPLPLALKKGPGKLLVKGGAAIAGGMALTSMFNKKVGQSFLVGALTLLAADIAKMVIGRSFPAVALSNYDDEMPVNEYMSGDLNEYMSGDLDEYMSADSDLGFVSTGPIVGQLKEGDDYDQDGMLMNYDDAELVEIDEF